ncbi:phosphonate C-P lyase system protein PhnH [Haladaptatus sp. DYF46]|uniref:phosphonate C-P lyase system protein PhnH n=1 Tax=Haladaptatus sp. DYF46 TaxID=2886041 RepID=UPI001E2C9543|nr:phosphonate C-P lyase system protein PhnH [Haladaptatus sp. DYF46]
MRALDIDPVHDTRATFRSLVDATSRPGTVETTAIAPATYSIVATLVDHEVTLYGGSDELHTTLERESRLDSAPFEEADVIVVDGDTDGDVTAAKRGSLKEPSDGATLVYDVETLATDAAPDADALPVAVSGPGVPDTRTFYAEGIPAEEVEAIATAQSSYPRGVDVYLTADDRVVGLPRSVTLTVVDEEGT